MSQATWVNAFSNTANASNTASIAAAAGKFSYITGFEITGGGATAATEVEATLTGTVAAGARYEISVPVGATAGITPLIVTFNPPLASAAVNTTISVSVPAFGAGNTNVAVNVHGYQQ